MTLSEIKTALSENKRVFHSSPAYEVKRDSIGQYLIICSLNDYTIGLTHRNGETMNGKEEDFYIG